MPVPAIINRPGIYPEYKTDPGFNKVSCVSLRIKIRTVIRMDYVPQQGK
jgi:hypothetical protein